MKTLRLFLVAALAAAFLSPLEHIRPAEAQTSVLQPPVRTMDAFIQRRAISKIGGSIGGASVVAWFWDDFQWQGASQAVAMGWSQQLVGTGAGATLLNDEGGGVHQLTTGATAASSATAFTNPPLVRNVSTTPFYFATRIKLTTAITAQTIAVSGLINAVLGTKTIAVGAVGALSAVNFVLQYDGLVPAGSFASFGVALDTNFHTFEVWAVGDGKLHFAIDFGSDLGPVTQAAAPTDSCSPTRQVLNGTDAVTRTIRFDWVAVLSKRT
jgi:hypothetical protein